MEKKMIELKEKEDAMIFVKEPNEFIKGKYNLNVLTLKLLSFLFTKIDPDKDEEFKKYEINLKEIEKILNKSYGNIYTYLKNSFKSLMKVELELEDENTWKLFTIVVEPTILKNSGIIYFYISPALLNLLKKSKHYLVYNIKILAYFNSAYSLRLYKLLRDRWEINKKYKLNNWEIEIKELQEILQAPYKRYSNFKQKVLTKALDEINKYGDIKVSFEEIKRGRKVESLKFYIQENKKDPAPAAAPKALPTNSSSSTTPKPKPQIKPGTTDLKQFRKEILKEYNNQEKYFLIEETEFKIKNNLLYVDNKCLSAADGLTWWNYIYKNRTKIKAIDPQIARKDALKELDEELKKIYIGKETFIGIKGEYTGVKIINVTLQEDWEHAEVIFQDSQDKNYKAVYSIEALKNLIS